MPQDFSPSHSRRLAAIFCADVAGYTRLVSADEAATLRLLTFHRGISDRLIAQHRGRIANTAGDSILAEFASASDALECALAVLERGAAANEEVTPDRRVTFRIGLHVGEVVVKGGDLFGDGVNVAARLQAMAPPGAVCVSELAYQLSHKMVTVPFEDLGPRLMKNLDLPVRVYLARPAGHAGENIPQIHRRAEAHLARRYHEICHAALLAVIGSEDLEGIEYAVLASLEDSPGIDRNRLAERIGIDLRNATRILKRLASRGFVEAELGSRKRLPAFTLTGSGLEVRRRLRPAIGAALDRVVAPLSNGERELLQDILTRVIQAHDAAKRPEPDR